MENWFLKFLICDARDLVNFSCPFVDPNKEKPN